MKKTIDIVVMVPTKVTMTVDTKEFRVACVTMPPHKEVQAALDAAGHNPFIEMERHNKQELTAMSLEQLLQIQRSVLFPDEQDLFDKEEFILLSKDDVRTEFIDYTDRLINMRYVSGSHTRLVTD